MEDDAMQVDTIAAVSVPQSLESAVQTLIRITDDCLRRFIHTQIEACLGSDMVSTFMPAPYESCTELLAFIDKKWISIFADSSISHLRHSVTQLRTLFKAVESNYTPDRILVASSTTASEIAQQVETLLMPIAPARAAEAGHLRLGIALLSSSPTNSKDKHKTVKKHAERQVGIVLDGANIGWKHGDSKRFSLRGTLLAYNYFVRRGHSPVVIFLPEARMEASGRYADSEAFDEMEKMRGSSQLVLVPSQDYDDAYICSYARRSKAVVVSNDAFRDFVYQASASGEQHGKEWHSWLVQCRLSFTFRCDEFLPNPSFNWSRAIATANRVAAANNTDAL